MAHPWSILGYSISGVFLAATPADLAHGLEYIDDRSIFDEWNNNT
ncbi:hypothetical protein BVG79_00156 [Ketogulonicigenium robustum]|uniref:Uncharacterized protein n=1 Tax=Ketogulonicigenium robustum TaxID=92947 RepID=A0A1W6NWA8_9RHOB|nr:hypothetical protein BVG79_00156 [Ketogulonicigenium robustum]